VQTMYAGVSRATHTCGHNPLHFATPPHTDLPWVTHGCRQGAGPWRGMREPGGAATCVRQAQAAVWYVVNIRIQVATPNSIIRRPTRHHPPTTATRRDKGTAWVCSLGWGEWA
jgi:hypothetical protein